MVRGLLQTGGRPLPFVHVSIGLRVELHSGKQKKRRRSHEPDSFVSFFYHHVYCPARLVEGFIFP